MVYCPNCGAVVDGRFCARCGAAVGTGSTGSASTQPPPGGTGTQAPVGGLTENLASMLCYLVGFITGIIFLVLEPYNRNRNIRFHAFQSIFLSVALFVISIALTILTIIMPWAMWALISILQLLLGLGAFALWLFLLFQTYNGKKVVLPVIGPMAEKQA